MTDEKNPILNPQAEGSNAASGSSSFRTEIEEEVDSWGKILSVYSSDFRSDKEISKFTARNRTEKELQLKINILVNQINERGERINARRHKAAELSGKDEREKEWEGIKKDMKNMNYFTKIHKQK